MQGREREAGRRKEISENISMEMGENAENEQTTRNPEEGARLAQPKPPSERRLGWLMMMSCWVHWCASPVSIQ